MNKYLALQKEVFDISKVTVVGEPTITSDGVASGITLNDYIKKEQTLDLSKPFEIKTKIKTFTLDSQQAIFSFDNTGWNNYLVIHANRITFWLCFNNVDVITLKIETPLQNNKEYYIDFSWNGNVYKLRVSEDGETWEETSYNSSEVLYGYSSISKVAFGRLATYNYYPFTGSIDLKQFSITVDNQLVFQPVKPTYLLERRKPKVWNKGQFTIVGSPSISESGIASGFSASNYITSKAVNLSTTKWEIKAKFKTNANGVVNGKVYALSKDFTNEGRFGIGLGFVQDGKFEITDTNDNATAWGGNALSSILASPNTTFYTKHYFDGTNIKLDISTDGRNYTNIITKVKTNNFIAFKSLEFGSLNKAVNFTGSIDLKEFKIYVDNNLVFDGGAETYVYDPSKFTVVGSPTITEYGVASGFSGSQIKLPILNVSGQIEKFRVGFNLLGTTSTASSMIARMYETDLMLYTNQTGKLEATQPTKYGAPYFLGVEPINRYANCILELILDKIQGKLTVNYYEDNVLIKTKTVSSTLPSLINSKYWEDGNSNNQWYLGNQGFSLFSGSIDLPSISITVDGKEVFTGAKENYYVLRR